jgi:hypothetical protein
VVIIATVVRLARVPQKPAPGFDLQGRTGFAVSIRAK